MFSNATQAVDWMEQRRFNTRGFLKFHAFMKQIGSPHDAVPSIHIAGTNGKGSTLNYIACALQEAGYKVGTFTSPYLETHFDRICMNHKTIPEDEFLSIVNTYATAFEKHDLNMFEIDMCIAAIYFKDKVDIAIYETGLGGRTDATNVLQPLLSIITNIGMDHWELLGDTYEKIATEKGGIIKPCTPFITGEKKMNCLAIFKELCKIKDSELLILPEVHVQASRDAISFVYQDIKYELKDTPMYQADNICIALEAITWLDEHTKFHVTNQQSKHAIINAKWLGRFEIMSRNPLIIVDGAHNKEGMEALCNSIQCYPDIHVIFTALADKDSDHMIESLLKISDDITICEFDFYRAGTAKTIAKDYPVRIIKDFRAAIQDAITKQGTILITGSLYFISEVRSYLKAQDY